MSADLRRFLKRLALFALPLLVYVGAIVVVDPYNFFGVSHVVPDHSKLAISYRLNYPMWKMLEYRRDPRPNLIFGDSRAMSIDESYVEDVAGGRWYNFGYGGGSLREAIDTFWFASERTRLKSVVFGVNLHNYNDTNRKNRVREVNNALRNPLLYCVNFNVLIAAERLVRTSLVGRVETVGTPRMTEGEFWRHQLDQVTRVYLSNYRYPEQYHRDLQAVATYCREHDIELSFIIMPNQLDLQEKIAEYHLEDAARRFRDDLRQLGTVYDFAWDNAMTANRDNYRDPYHFNDEFMRLIVRSVWGSEREYVRILTPPAAPPPSS